MFVYHLRKSIPFVSMTPSPSTFTAFMSIPLFHPKFDRRANAADVPIC